VLSDPGSSRPRRLHAGIRERYRVELIKVQCFRYINANEDLARFAQERFGKPLHEPRGAAARLFPAKGEAKPSAEGPGQSRGL